MGKSAAAAAAAAAAEAEIDPTAVFENRKRALEEMRRAGIEPYPHKFNVDLTVPAFVAKYDAAVSENGKVLDDVLVAVAGRLYSKREASSKLIFYDMYDNMMKVQVLADASRAEQDFASTHANLKRGDVVGVIGNPGRSSRGELSIFVRKIVLLSACMHHLPTAHDGFKDMETRYRHRYLDLIVNQENRKTFITRARIIQYVRRYLDQRDFIEVETPILNMIPSGAAARPFTTHHNELNMQLYLRIAPELFLKECVVGGMNRVYEIGRLFRNEGIDLTHNPEFTTCEFYMAYADYHDLMTMTEEMLSGMVKELCGSYKITVGDREIDFTPPFKRVSLVDGVEEVLGVKLPADLESQEAVDMLDALCRKHNIDCPTKTVAKLLDKLVGEFIEPTLVNPAFIIDHPVVMSPLAKGHRSRPGLTERFELFVNTRELCNAYTELNHPIVQRERFLEQAGARERGDDEAMQIDEVFCQSLEYGLPPTAGWGMGIDRLTMLLTNQSSIKEVLLFPAMKPDIKDAAGTSGGAAGRALDEAQFVAAHSASTSVPTPSAGAAAPRVGPGLVHVACKLAHVPPLKVSGTGKFSADVDGATIEGQEAIARAIARKHADAQLLGRNGTEAKLVDDWLRFVHHAVTTSQLPLLDQYLAPRTLFAGAQLTLADAAVWEALYSEQLAEHVLAHAATYPHLSRWLAYVNTLKEFSGTLRNVQPPAGKAKPAGEAPAAAAAAAAAAASAAAAAAAPAAASASAVAAPQAAAPSGKELALGSPVVLHGAVMGQVVTRFPPEPSGYLHIGHAKAAFINYLSAKAWNGRMVFRFEDTNPNKEKVEYIDSIVQDLRRLGVPVTTYSFTSDFFDEMMGMCEKLLREGKAYVDDTPKEQMRAERAEGISSASRANTPERNLALWAEMVAGSEAGLKCCVRAKMDMSAVNKALRDPVLYRCNLTPHHRTGTKYKVYPTYDFACPITDSIEGITHAMRTNEYHDRNPQYMWVLDALGMRKPLIEDYSRLNLKRTVMSKRRLQWFVSEGLVEGWNDPRFPTVQGILRRGLVVPALQEFVCAQGASKNVNMMEWDKIWAINRTHIDPVAPRLSAIVRDTAVTVHLSNGPAGVEARSVARHPKNASLGDKLMQYASTLLIEADDAATLAVGETITLVHWGNAVVERVERASDAADARVSAVHARLDPANRDFKNTKKLTWVAVSADNVDVVLTEFDYLITKDKIEEGELFEDFVTKQSRFDTLAVGESNLRSLKVDDIVQIERRGFFRCDSPYKGPQAPAVLFAIPDGKTKHMSTLSTKVAPAHVAGK